MIACDGGILFPLASSFASAEMASSAIEDVVSNPKPKSTPTGYIYQQDQGDS